jgi:5-methylcytosine-specific restriction endonuclease McrA
MSYSSERVRAWRQRHPDEARLSDIVYKGMRRSATFQRFWPLIVEHYGPCVRCRVQGRVPTGKTCVDHVISVMDDPERYNVLINLQPLCRSCNNKKGRNTEDYRPDGGAWISTLRPIPIHAGDHRHDEFIKPLHRARSGPVPGRVVPIANYDHLTSKHSKVKQGCRTLAAYNVFKRRCAEKGIEFDPCAGPFSTRGLGHVLERKSNRAINNHT